MTKGESGWILTMFSLVLGATPGFGAEADSTGLLVVAQYEASVYSFAETGILLWLEGPDGVMRIEVGRGNRGETAAAATQKLLYRAGAGWTAILSDGKPPTINTWGDVWRTGPEELSWSAIAMAQAVLAGPEPTGAVPTRWRAGTARLRHRVDLHGGGPRGFRGDLTFRGYGRGGMGGTLDFFWLPDQAGNLPRVEISSSRYPGHIVLAVIDQKSVTYTMPEAFVPLWPLAGMVHPAN